MIQSNMHKILNDLKWQIEAGIDEVISESERKDFMAKYKQAAGFAIENLNASPPTIQV